LRSFDGLLNIVLDDALEYLRDPSDFNTVTDATRFLGQVVVRGTAVTVLGPEDGSSPFQTLSWRRRDRMLSEAIDKGTPGVWSARALARGLVHSRVASPPPSRRIMGPILRTWGPFRAITAQQAPHFLHPTPCGH
jgi:hypothetical protein